MQDDISVEESKGIIACVTSVVLILTLKMAV